MGLSYKKHPSPNCEKVKIPVEFLVLHSTSLSLKKTLQFFTDPSFKASSHLVVDRGGEVFEVVSCLEGNCFKAWHAGASEYVFQEKTWKGFNDFSIGIELVNWSGNFFAYTSKQYEALRDILKALKVLYPALSRPERVLGHEHIAGYRGKADPGHGFDWDLFFKMNYSPPFPVRSAVMSVASLDFFKKQASQLKKKAVDEDWMKFSSQIEKRSF